jgi:hypothetical protein
MDNISYELNLAQLNRCIQKTKTNKYSDNRKKEYQNNLLELYDKIILEDFLTFSKKELSDRKKIVDFIFLNIQYLDNSTLTITPFELLFCLEKILDDWLPTNPHIIVTCLDNNLMSYQINYKLMLDNPIHTLIKEKYGITFKYELIQITLPRYYVHDYLANVALYHEVGHYIDRKYNISKVCILNDPANHPSKISKDRLQIKYAHQMEYFADIFAAQYIGSSLNYFLDYAIHEQPECETHPSTIDRLDIVNKFLSGEKTPNSIINELKEKTLILSKKELKIRHKIIPLDDFYDLIPVEIESESDLHSLILAGWNFWRTRPNKIINQLNKDITYKIINNLIEKSISNYIVKENWSRKS